MLLELQRFCNAVIQDPPTDFRWQKLEAAIHNVVHDQETQSGVKSEHVELSNFYAGWSDWIDTVGRLNHIVDLEKRIKALKAENQMLKGIQQPRKHAKTSH